MIYEEYHELLKKYKKAENSYFKELDKKSRLLYGVEPHATKPKEMIVDYSYGNPDDAIINYSSEIDEVNELINETRNNKDVLEYELRKKEKELRYSYDIYDKIYVYKWLEHKRVNNYYKLLNYSKRQIYRFIDEIKDNLYKKDKMAQNGTNSIV